jgi:hypothetical protein
MLETFGMSKGGKEYRRLIAAFERIFGAFGLINQLGAVEYARPRRFREKLQQWLRTIRLVWPECPAEISPDGNYLSVNHSIAIHPSNGLDHLSSLPDRLKDNS